MSGSQQETEIMPDGSTKEFSEGTSHRAVGRVRNKQGSVETKQDPMGPS